MLQVEAKDKYLHFGEIADLEDPITGIVEQILKDDRRYDLIIGDDKSGRIPTLIVGKVLNALAQEQGQDPIPVRFLWTSSSNMPTDLRKILQDLEEKPERTLLVTEYVSNGYTIEKFKDIFQKEELNYDVATISIEREEETYRHKESISSHTSLYFYDQNSRLPGVYGKPHLSGLLSGFANNQTIAIRGADARKDVVSAREDVALLSERIVSKLRQKMKNP